MASISLGELQDWLDSGLDRTVASVAMFDKMGASLLASVRQGIQSEKAPDGTPWAQLKAATVRRRGSAHPILRHTNRLYQSITYAHDREHAQVGTNMTYARRHQKGGESKHKAGMRSMYFSLNKKSGKLRLVKKSRSNFVMDARHGDYTVNIPARPYLYNTDKTVPQTWKDPLIKIFLRTLKSAMENR